MIWMPNRMAGVVWPHPTWALEPDHLFEPEEHDPGAPLMVSTAASEPYGAAAPDWALAMRFAKTVRVQAAVSGIISADIDELVEIGAEGDTMRSRWTKFLGDIWDIYEIAESGTPGEEGYQAFSVRFSPGALSLALQESISGPPNWGLLLPGSSAEQTLQLAALRLELDDDPEDPQVVSMAAGLVATDRESGEGEVDESVVFLGHSLRMAEDGADESATFSCAISLFDFVPP
jgi:hypothetical protein